MTTSISVDVKGLLPLKQQLQLIAMPAPKRRRLLYRVAKWVMRDSKKRVRKQVDLNGKPFTLRKRKRARKMLSKLVKDLKVISNNSTQAILGFHNPVVGRIASKHQHGFTESINAKKLARKTKGSHHDPATRRQAKALRQAGFKVKSANGKRMKSPSLKWITQNMKIGQAGAALRWLREEAGENIQSNWTTVLPARSFLGATATDVSGYIETIFKQMTQEIAYVAR